MDYIYLYIYRLYCYDIRFYDDLENTKTQSFLFLTSISNAVALPAVIYLHNKF